MQPVRSERPGSVELDAVIFGGGAAGLWLLDTLHRRGFSTLLIERHALGAGQTIASQGIIHGGIKYTLAGSLTPSARAIREMPGLWQAYLDGRRPPDLREARVHSACCYLWRTESLRSALGMIGARVGLRSGVERVEQDRRPDALAGCPGDVFRVAEPVLDMPSVVRALAAGHSNRIIKIEDTAGVEFETSGPGRVERVTLRGPDGPLALSPRYVLFTAGAGNGELRLQVGLTSDAMQLRPLHMVLVRGRLPIFFGHCVDGAKTRVTITSATDSQGRTVWQIGGQLSEDGVGRDADSLIAHARHEIACVLPGVNLDGTEWTTYRVDRAEGRTSGGLRPQGPTVQVEGNTITAWPTKLALAPETASMIADRCLPAGSDGTVGVARPTGPDEVIDAVKDFVRPDIALPPWERSATWRT